MLRHSLLIGGLALSIAATVPVALAPGLSFSIRTSTSTQPAREGGDTRVRVLNGLLRFDAADGKSHVLFTPAQKSLTFVMPLQQQFFELKMSDSTAEGAGAMFQLMAAATPVSDIKVVGATAGSGGNVGGYPTTRYRIRMTYAEAPNGNTAAQRRITSVEEFWVTKALTDVPDPLEAFTRAFGGKGGTPAIGGTASDLMRQRGDAQRKLFTGLPLKTVATVTTTEADGRVTKETTTTEIVDLKRVDLDPSSFAVPASFKRLDGKSFTNWSSQLTDAIGAKVKEEAAEVKTEVKTEAKDEAKAAATSAKDDAKEKAKCALGRFVRKNC